MSVDDFFITEDFTTTTPASAERATETVEQATLFDACTYRGPHNRKGVENVAAIDPFGNLTV